MDLADPLDEGLAQEGGARPAPVDPVLVAAALGDRRDAGVLLERGGVGEALAPLAEGGEQPRGEDRASARQGAKSWKSGRRSQRRAISASSGRCRRTARGAAAQSASTSKRAGSMTAGSVVSGRSDLMASMRRSMTAAWRTLWRVEEGDEGLASGALGGLQTRASARRSRRRRRSPCRETSRDLGEVRLEGERQAIGEPDAILHEVAASLDEASERAHVGALTTQRLELVAVAKQQLQSDLGVGRVVLGAARGEGAPVLGEGGGVDREDARRMSCSSSADTIGPWAQLEADGDGAATKRSRRLCGPVSGWRPGGARGRRLCGVGQGLKSRRRASGRPSRCR